VPKYNAVTYNGHRYENESIMCQSLGLNRQTYDSVKRRFKGDQVKAIIYLLKGKKVEVEKEEKIEKVIRDSGAERFKEEGQRKTKDIMEEYDFE
jgi:hypothetical protein